MANSQDRCARLGEEKRGGASDPGSRSGHDPGASMKIVQGSGSLHLSFPPQAARTDSCVRASRLRRRVAKS